MFTVEKSFKYTEELKNSYDVLVNYQKQKYHTFLVVLLALVVIISACFIYLKEFNIVLASMLAIVGISLEFRRLDFNKKVSQEEIVENQNKATTMIGDIKEYFSVHIDDMEPNKQKEFTLLMENKLANLQSEVAVALFILSPSK